MIGTSWENTSLMQPPGRTPRGGEGISGRTFPAAVVVAAACQLLHELVHGAQGTSDLGLWDSGMVVEKSESDRWWTRPTDEEL